jgi:uncharacterized protein with ParB-like and HNH nuclease domain
MKKKTAVEQPEPEYAEDYSTDDIRDEADTDVAVAPVRYEISSYGIDFDVKGLVERLRQDKVYVPEFQRSFVWRLPDSSRFIESLLLGLPVPGIFLAKDPGSQKLFVIDGQQRLKSLQYFYDGVFRPDPGRSFQRSFRLTHVQKQFETKRYEDLDERARQILDDSVIHATIVKQDSPKDDDTSIYHVYERLNSGGRLLHPQEIRTAVFHGPLIEAIREANGHPAWRTLFGTKSPRLKDEEMILRFMALYEWSEAYDRPMAEFLSRFAQKNRYLTGKDLADFVGLFKRSMDIIFKASGEKAFRPERNFNAAVFDSVSYGVAKRVARDKNPSVESIKKSFNQLLSDKAYLQATSRSTADKAFVDRRLAAAAKAFAG